MIIPQPRTTVWFLRAAPLTVCLTASFDANLLPYTVLRPYALVALDQLQHRQTLTSTTAAKWESQLARERKASHRSIPK